MNGILTLRSSGLSDRFFKKPADTAESADSKDPLLGDTIKAEQDKVKEDKRKHQELLRKYLVVYLLAVLSDWLQGPYVYALYGEYYVNIGVSHPNLFSRLALVPIPFFFCPTPLLSGHSSPCPIGHAPFLTLFTSVLCQMIMGTTST